jgi:plasmid stability protein
MTSKRYSFEMEQAKRATVYFDADVHRALRLRAAACNRSISDMVNEAVRMTLAEDADDLRDTDQREAEQSSSFEVFVTSLRDSGRI